MSIATRRVVVTGLGLVTPLATGVKASWERLINSKSGLVSLTKENRPEHFPSTQHDFDGLPSTVAGVVLRGSKTENLFDPSEWLERGDDRKMADFTQYALCAAQQALEDAGWLPDNEEDRIRTGVCVGSGIGSVEDIASTANTYYNQGYRRVSPMFIPRILVNMAAGHLTLKYGLKGPNHAASTACTTGAHSIGDAMRFIQFGDADVMVAGGSEASITPLSIAGFARAKSLSTAFNQDPTAASRPFDKGRDGFVIGEGSGIVVLEELEHAKKRGAHIYAEIRGYGLSGGDANHMTAPPEDGNGAARAMKRAMEVAGLSASDIDYINAHATSTPLGDAAENRAIKSIFQNKDAKRIAVSSTKSAIGHLLGAAGAVEAIFTILAVNKNVVPPTLNFEQPSCSTEFNLNYVPKVAQEKEVRAAITNSFGFGGTNASLCFSKYS
ncbi:3-oxoacyl-synth [Basidiobolus meristosporus CBS 931.73]|uniref:3-oxoacyl-[acyl-carrier-protein] synthase n=1 Tax=Basidiobolus meristosporus CBS 931.73 TaxID=1314790 RepID=A0A1Y1YYF8_9FUNG|nr:3-oxoacyl-synth [Basidiobolus meristosporus CBS 931.73]|eukprot:ORY02914.1 3-oxoacyl-synth [Basidiobolus meristosporus CBS 931.73]